MWLFWMAFERGYRGGKAKGEGTVEEMVMVMEMEMQVFDAQRVMVMWLFM